jgi:dihydroflavonol-4-reductase
MRIFVTGGSGLLGNTILRRLASTEHQTATLLRGEAVDEVFGGLDTEIFRGDLSDLACLDQAAAWADLVIHSAGLIQLGWTRLEESLRVNRDGTRNLVNACLKQNCRLLHVGTVNTIAVGSRQRVADETTALDHAGGQIPCSYVVSKRAANDEILKGVDQGLQAILLHPGFMLGPWDWKPSSGRMMLEVGRSWKPFAPSGGCSVCDARDVADAIINAIHADVPSGRHYVLAGYNETYYRLWSEMSKRFGQPRPLMRVGPLNRIIAAKGGDLYTRVFGRESDLNSATLRMGSQYHWYDSSRAKSELGYHNRPLAETLDDAANWIRARHLSK